MTKIISMFGLLAIASAGAWAQGGGGNVVVLSDQSGAMGGVKAKWRLGLTGQPVKGAPYSADGMSETSQTLADGTHINHQENYSIYRDGEGRVRRESGDQVWISDPVANVSYILDTKEQTARKLNLAKPGPDEPAGPGQLKKLKAEAEARTAGPIWFSTGAAGGGMVIGGPGPRLAVAVPDGGELKPENLGKQEMEGVEVEGTRFTTTIPQGQIGNDRPLQIVRERWESPDLHVTIYAKHTDPMMGETVERLTNVRRGEPDPNLFQVPAGYRMEQDQ